MMRCTQLLFIAIVVVIVFLMVTKPF